MLPVSYVGGASVAKEVREVMRILRTINERLRKTVDKTKEGEEK